jgi:RHS repeat-associated protein
MLYGADGRLLKRVYKQNQSIIQKIDYLSNVEIHKDTVKEIYHKDGRLEKKNGIWQYEYWLKDHLGNLRSTFRDINNDSYISQNEIITRNDYYAFGLEMAGSHLLNGNRFAYGGKERLEQMNLGLLDFGARNLDKALGRWLGVDPLADEPEQIDKSPYAYGWNNPIKYDDPDGRCPNCLTALGGALLQGGIELGSQLLAGKSLGEVDWADVGVEALQGAAKGSGIGLLASGAVEVVGTFAKASTDVTFDGGTKTVFNGSKSKTEAAVDVVIDKTAGAVGKKIASSSKAAVASTTNAVESSNKALKKAENAYNKATDGGKNAYGSKATGVTQKLADARANASGAAAQQVVTKTANKVVNSTAGKVAGKAADTSIGDKVKRWFGF